MKILSQFFLKSNKSHNIYPKFHPIRAVVNNITKYCSPHTISNNLDFQYPKEISTLPTMFLYNIIAILFQYSLIGFVILRMQLVLAISYCSCYWKINIEKRLYLFNANNNLESWTFTSTPHPIEFLRITQKERFIKKLDSRMLFW